MPIAPPRSSASAYASAHSLAGFFAAHAGAGAPWPATPAAGLRALAEAGLATLPLPGHGATLARWQALAAVGGHDLGLAKLYEGHTDALAILAELGGHRPGASGLWGVWCAEAPEARLELRAVDGGRRRLDGRKAWCSGAAGVSHALVSCWNADGAPCIAAVELNQPGVTITADGWAAVGMAASASVDVVFNDVTAYPLGHPGAYVERPGFWHGGIGVAACWYGAAQTLAGLLQRRLHPVAPAAGPAAAAAGPAAAAASASDPLRLAQLGRIDIALASAAALLRAAAVKIDVQPHVNAAALALRTRLAVEAAATDVLSLATRALGAGPLCRDAAVARMVADLPVFLRQSHAERDLAALGAEVATREVAPWSL